MKKHFAYFVAAISLAFFPIHYISHAADLTLPQNAPTKVCFSLQGGCPAAIIDGIEQTKGEILVQA